MGNSQLIRLGLASGFQTGGRERLHRCSTVWGELSGTAIVSESQLQGLDRKAQAFMAFLLVRGREFDHVQNFESQLQLPSVSESQGRGVGLESRKDSPTLAS